LFQIVSLCALSVDVPVLVVIWRNVTAGLNEDFIDNEVFCCENKISEKYFPVRGLFKKHPT